MTVAGGGLVGLWKIVQLINENTCENACTSVQAPLPMLRFTEVPAKYFNYFFYYLFVIMTLWGAVMCLLPKGICVCSCVDRELNASSGG